MRHPARFALIAAAVLLAACQEPSSPTQPRSGGLGRDLLGVVAGRYIVVFQDAVTDPAGLAQSLVSAYGGSLSQTYTSALKGFAASLSDAAVAALRQNPLVAYIETDQLVQTDGTEQMDANGDPWGLDRIDQRALPLSGTYSYTATSAGVHAYIIDTGIWTDQAEFGGRADNVYDILGLDGLDCNGHGTHVAGTVGAATFGVAKEVFLHGVRVFFNCGGVGWTSDLLAGVDWVTAHHASPAVANISLTDARSDALNTAVTNLSQSGVFVTVAAGNKTDDACLYSPGSASGAFTVAASTKTDAKADFSNWGSCVKAYAPGSDIKSTWLTGMTMTMSGTSMAAPHVTGVAALYKATFGDAPSATVSKWIISNATTGAITGNPAGTPNLLLFKSTF